MKVLDSIIDFPNKKWGEDRLFVSKYQAGVIDGSSPINIIPVQGYQSQAEWLSDNLSRGLSEDSTTKLPIACKTITDDLKAYNSSIIEQFNEYNSPCAVIAGVQTVENELYGYVLGDCTLSIQLKTGEIKSYTDKRINYYSNLTKELKNKALLSGEDSKEAVKRQMTENRKSMNIEGGFWTVAFKGEFQDQFVECHYKAEEVKRILLFSDGFERGFINSLYSIHEVMAGEISLSRSLSILRDWENSVTGAEVKKHDDVSAVLIEL